MLSLAFWIGMLVIKGIVLNGFEQSSILLARSEKWSQPLQWICLLVLLVSQVVTLILQMALFSQSQNTGPLDPATLGQTLIQSSYGFLWIAHIIFILGSLGLLWWATSRQNQLSLPRPFTIVWLVLAGLILLTYSFTDDVAQLNTQLYIYAIVLIWLSLAAQYIWFGGLAYLAYVLIPLLKTIETSRRNEILTNLLRRFYPLMLTAICVLFVSELYLTTISLSNIQQFRTTAYGRALLVKWVLILMMILVSAYAFFVLRPKMSASTRLQPVNTGITGRNMHRVALNQTTRSVQRLFSIQSWLGVAVLLCAALMTIFVPPIGLPGENSRQNIPSSGTPANTNATQTKQVGNLSVMLTVTPAVTGVSNTVIVSLTDTRSGKAVTNAHIEISPNMELMNMGTVQATMTGGTPAYKATFAQGATFSMSGIWDIKLIIQLPNQGPLVIVFTVLFLSRL